MERNTVYTRWKVCLTTRVTDTVLQVRYDAINCSVPDNYVQTFRFCCNYHAFREVIGCTVPDNKRKRAARICPGLDFLYVVKTQEHS
jgi:hypothetical protein